MEKLPKEAVAIPLSIIVKAIKKSYGNKILSMDGDWGIAKDANEQHSLILNAKDNLSKKISFCLSKKAGEDYLKFYWIGENLQERTKLCYQLLGSQIAIFDDMGLMGSGKHKC